MYKMVNSHSNNYYWSYYWIL